MRPAAQTLKLGSPAIAFVFLILAASHCVSVSGANGGGKAVSKLTVPLNTGAESLWCRYGLPGCEDGIQSASGVRADVTQSGVWGGGSAASVGSASAGLPSKRTMRPNRQQALSSSSSSSVHQPTTAAESWIPRGWGSPGRLLQQLTESIRDSSDSSTPGHSGTLGSSQPVAGTPAAVGSTAEDTVTQAAPALRLAALDAVSAAKKAAAQAVQAAMSVAAKVPVWVLLLLGTVKALVVAAQLRSIYKRILRRTAEQPRQTPAEMGAAGTVPGKDLADRSTCGADLEAAEGDECQQPTHTLLPSSASGDPLEPLLSPPASVDGSKWQKLTAQHSKHAHLAASISSTSAAKSKPSPAVEAAAAATPTPAAPSVDPSVQARDLSKTGWVATAACEHQGGSPFGSQLYYEAADSMEPAGMPANGWDASALPAIDSDSGSWSDATWHSKQAVWLSRLERGQSEAATDSFRLLAATAVSQAASQQDSSPGQLPPAPVACTSKPTSSTGQPGTPAKRPPGAARKLTAAKSIKPQDLPSLPAVEEGEAGEAPADKEAVQAAYCAAEQESLAAAPSGLAASMSLASPAATYSSIAAKKLAQQAQQRPGSSSGSSGANRATTTTNNSACQRPIRGVALLSPQQFKQEVQLRQLLGVGAAGCVYAAEWQGQQVAVKLMHPSCADARSFAREVEMMAAVGKHPCVISCLAACLEPPLTVVQELAASSLHAQLHQQHRRPAYGTLLQLAEDIAAALAHCHSRQPPVVHRDLSAQNVLLGVDGRARLADFGLAAAKRRTFLSGDRGGLGTAAYMAPECMQGGQISEKCDVFSLAVLIWEMLTGQCAWSESGNALQIFFAVGVERRRLPIPAGCPPALAKLLRACWHHQPAARPSAQEVLQRLKRMRTQDSFSFRPPPQPKHQLLLEAGQSGVAGSTRVTAALKKAAAATLAGKPSNPPLMLPAGAEGQGPRTMMVGG